MRWICSLAAAAAIAAFLACGTGRAAPVDPSPTDDPLQPATWITPAVSAPGVYYVRFRSAAVGGEVSCQPYLSPVHMVSVNGLPNGMWVDDKNGRTPVESMFTRDIIAP